MKRNYLDPLKAAFEANQDASKAIAMSRYLKDKFPFYGIDAKPRREIQKVFFKENGLPDKKDLESVLMELWELPQREFQGVGVDILVKFEKKLLENDIIWIEKLIVSKSWWDTVDILAAWTCGSYFKLFPKNIKPITESWIKSGNIWLQRSTLLFQLKYKSQTDTGLLEKYILELKDIKEFFVQKAIGWVLREYSKVNPAWVKDFIGRVQLSNLSYREASKYI
jgi:3-methyladenine DNA glycosylase AlkD